MCQHGFGIDKNMKKAKEYFKKAAEKNNKSALNNLAYSYYLQYINNNNNNINNNNLNNNVNNNINNKIII